MMVGVGCASPAQRASMMAQEEPGLRLGATKIMATLTTGALQPSVDDLRELVLREHMQGSQVAVHAVEAEAVEAGGRCPAVCPGSRSPARCPSSNRALFRVPSPPGGKDSGVRRCGRDPARVHSTMPVIGTSGWQTADIFPTSTPSPASPAPVYPSEPAPTPRSPIPTRWPASTRQ